MRRPFRLLTLVCGVAMLAALGSPVFAQPARRAIALDDLHKIKSVGDPQRSPDGRWIAYTVGTVETEKDTRNSDIWMVSSDGTQALQLTFTPDGESAPRWSPDGKYLSFLASRGTEEDRKKGAQVWLLDRTGGEAQPLTDIDGGVADYSWSPDSTRLLFTKTDKDPDDAPDKKEGWKRKTTPPIVIDRYHFKQDRDGYVKRLYSHIWVFDIASKKAEQMTNGSFDDEAPAWSPDGTKIVFVSKRTGVDPDRAQDSNIFVVDAKTGAEPRALTTYVGADGGRPSWSPDGQWVAYLQSDETRFSAYYLPKVAVVSASGGSQKVLTASLDRPVQGALCWSADGKSLTFVVADDRASYVGRTPVSGGPVEKLTTGRRTVGNISMGKDGVITLLGATATEPPEVHVLQGSTLRKVTKVNETLFAELQLGMTEDFTSRSKDGTEVHSLVVKPASYVAGRKYPTLLIIHGGPNGQDQYAFSYDREFFAAQGYVVLSVNYRGSAARGEAYQKAIYADWGNKEVMDLLGAVDGLVAAGVADPDRLGIGGWSYGGILTDYTTATDQRFKAAVSGAGSALQLAMYGSDQYITQYENELGVPWKTRDLWLRISYPFFQADRIKTPTLYMGGEKDFNVPIIGSEQMYQALKSLGVDTQLVIYPGQFHGLTTPSYQRDRLERYLAWFNKYLK
jgi:dipeptidyl aminopeptidase/acylaminoacyl peptidase